MHNIKSNPTNIPDNIDTDVQEEEKTPDKTGRIFEELYQESLITEKLTTSELHKVQYKVHLKQTKIDPTFKGLKKVKNIIENQKLQKNKQNINESTSIKSRSSTSNNKSKSTVRDMPIRDYSSNAEVDDNNIKNNINKKQDKSKNNTAYPNRNGSLIQNNIKRSTNLSKTAPSSSNILVNDQNSIASAKINSKQRFRTGRYSLQPKSLSLSSRSLTTHRSLTNVTMNATKKMKDEATKRALLINKKNDLQIEINRINKENKAEIAALKKEIEKLTEENIKLNKYSSIVGPTIDPQYTLQIQQEYSELNFDYLQNIVEIRQNTHQYYEDEVDTLKKINEALFAEYEKKFPGQSFRGFSMNQDNNVNDEDEYYYTSSDSESTSYSASVGTPDDYFTASSMDPQKRNGINLKPRILDGKDKSQNEEDQKEIQNKEENPENQNEEEQKSEEQKDIQNEEDQNDIQNKDEQSENKNEQEPKETPNKDTENNNNTKSDTEQLETPNKDNDNINNTKNSPEQKEASNKDKETDTNKNEEDQKEDDDEEDEETTPITKTNQSDKKDRTHSQSSYYSSNNSLSNGINYVSKNNDLDSNTNSSSSSIPRKYPLPSRDLNKDIINDLSTAFARIKPRSNSMSNLRNNNNSNYADEDESNNNNNFSNDENNSNKSSNNNCYVNSDYQDLGPEYEQGYQDFDDQIQSLPHVSSEEVIKDNDQKIVKFAKIHTDSDEDSSDFNKPDKKSEIHQSSSLNKSENDSDFIVNFQKVKKNKINDSSISEIDIMDVKLPSLDVTSNPSSTSNERFNKHRYSFNMTDDEYSSEYLRNKLERLEREKRNNISIEFEEEEEEKENIINNHNEEEEKKKRKKRKKKRNITEKNVIKSSFVIEDVKNFVNDDTKRLKNEITNLKYQSFVANAQKVSKRKEVIDSISVKAKTNKELEVAAEIIRLQNRDLVEKIKKIEGFIQDEEELIQRFIALQTQTIRNPTAEANAALQSRLSLIQKDKKKIEEKLNEKKEAKKNPSKSREKKLKDKRSLKLYDVSEKARETFMQLEKARANLNDTIDKAKYLLNDLQKKDEAISQKVDQFLMNASEEEAFYVRVSMENERIAAELKNVEEEALRVSRRFGGVPGGKGTRRALLSLKRTMTTLVNRNQARANEALQKFAEKVIAEREREEKERDEMEKRRIESQNRKNDAVDKNNNQNENKNDNKENGNQNDNENKENESNDDDIQNSNENENKNNDDNENKENESNDDDIQNSNENENKDNDDNENKENESNDDDIQNSNENENKNDDDENKNNDNDESSNGKDDENNSIENGESKNENGDGDLNKNDENANNSEDVDDKNEDDDVVDIDEEEEGN